MVGNSVSCTSGAAARSGSASRGATSRARGGAARLSTVVADLKPFVRRPASFVLVTRIPRRPPSRSNSARLPSAGTTLAVVAETDERGSGLGSQARRAARVLDLGAEQRRRQRLRRPDRTRHTTSPCGPSVRLEPAAECVGDALARAVVRRECADEPWRELRRRQRLAELGHGTRDVVRVAQPPDWPVAGAVGRRPRSRDGAHRHRQGRRSWRSRPSRGPRRRSRRRGTTGTPCSRLTRAASRRAVMALSSV